ncbi:hypothetical protein [Cohnella sp.]|uniref:hypothetical protein n=1 Tax=Cohnella sp. TaxID=1883426 RepID=UPI0035616EFE
MNPLLPFQQDKRWLWTAVIGFLLFLLIQAFPITGQLFATDVHPVMSRSEAESKAIEIAAARFAVQSDEIDRTSATHLSDSQTVGYFSKYGLMDAYKKQWSSSTPTDVYAIDLQLIGESGHLLIYLHMESGDLVAWQHLTDTASTASTASVQPASEGSQLASEALGYAAFYGINASEWEWSGTVEDDGSVRFESRKSDINESSLWMKVIVPADFSMAASSIAPWIGGKVTYGFDLSAAFTAYMKEQGKLSTSLTTYGFIIPQIIFFIIAIVYAGTHGGQSSYRRGILLSALFFAMYVGITINMIPGLRAGSWEATVAQGNGASTAIIVISIAIYAGMALLTYFSAVGGDGLWKSMGKSLWPRWQEGDYGVSVLRSMRAGYFLAFILLGAQSVILLVLEKSLGSFASSDATQSMYNMRITWILPLLAWCAGISEELQSRLLGIGVFRSWFVGGARKLLRRELSTRTTVMLTAAAMIPPGLLWAMGHVSYAIYPVYTRIIELVLMAMLFGWFMLRFGIMTVIFAHVTLNAILMGMQMMFDGLPGDFYGGIFSLVMPGLVGIAIWWVHGLFRGKAKPVVV